ncbi:hypothetical protein B0H11DRAFT_436621 [Mycena galericulata]|nr:hypothetical protein B0H11DRAFT_436621 [Mycena galericulata]
MHRTILKNLDEARAHNSTLKFRCDTLDAEIASLRVAHESVSVEKDRLQEACGKVVQLVEHIRAIDARKKTDGRNPSQKPETVDLTQDDDRETDASQTAPSRELENSPPTDGASPSAQDECDILSTLKEEMSVYCAHMDTLPQHGRQPRITQLRPICEYTRNLNAQALVQNLDLNILAHPVLFLPNRTVPMTNGNVIAFGPTHVYDLDEQKWTPGSDLDGLDGTTQELFVKPQGSPEVFYAGLYKCIDLYKLYPGQQRVSLPPEIAQQDLTYSVSKAAMPSIRSKKHRKRLMEEFLAGGRMEVACLGLRRVGFNSALDSALHGDSGCSGLKREAEGEGGGSLRKKQRRANDEKA